MSFHSDDEPELGINPVIASVTLGEARPFVFKHKTKEKYTQVLEHGSVLIMAGTTQSHYVHGIAKTANLSVVELILHSTSYSQNKVSQMQVKAFLETTIEAALNPSFLEVVDESFMHNVPEGAQVISK